MTVVTADSVSRRGRAVLWIDRLLPLAWLLVYLLLPVSGRSGDAFAFWNDQILYLEALRQLLDTGSAEAIESNTVGPAFIALAALVHLASGLSPEDSFVVLNRTAYALTVAGGMLLVRWIVTGLVRSPAASLSAQLVFFAVALSTWTWHWSDFPWTHFVAAFLCVALYVVRFVPATPTVLTAGATGALLALLALTRSFELVAVALAWILVALLAAERGARSERRALARRFLAGTASFLLVALAIHAATGKDEPFVLYSSHLDRQVGTVSSEELASTPALVPGLVPTKAVQLLVDPCFDSNCAVDDYEGGPRSVYELWRMPLLVQLPGLALLPVCVLVVAGLLGLAVARRDRAVLRRRVVRAIVELTVAATGIAVGYLASTIAGSNHLKYGFAREFMLPATLAAIVVCGLAVAAAWTQLSRREAARVRSETAILALGLAGVAAVLVLTSWTRTSGLPRIESRHLAAIRYAADCPGTTCSVTLRARGPNGARRELPEASTLTFGCGSEDAALTLYVTDLGSVAVPASCSRPRLVAAWPLVMGLPATPDELYAVTVSNTGGR